MSSLDHPDRATPLSPHGKVMDARTVPCEVVEDDLPAPLGSAVVLVEPYVVRLTTADDPLADGILRSDVEVPKPGVKYVTPRVAFTGPVYARVSDDVAFGDYLAPGETPGELVATDTDVVEGCTNVRVLETWDEGGVRRPDDVATVLLGW
jgi:hypothetical protein